MMVEMRMGDERDCFVIQVGSGEMLAVRGHVTVNHVRV